MSLRIAALWPRVAVCAGTLALVSSLLSSPSLAASAVSVPQEVWTLQTGAEIVFEHVTPLGSLLVSTDANLRVVNTSSGKTLWLRDDIQKLRERDYGEIAGTPYGLFYLGEGPGGGPPHLEVIDLETGNKKWDSRNLPLRSTQGVFQIPQRDLLILAGTPKKGGKPALVGVDISTGQVRWQQDSLFTKPLQLFEVEGGRLFKRYSVDGNQVPLFDSPETAILYLTEDGPVKLDLATGRKLWTASKLKGSEPPALRYGYAPMLLGDSMVFVPHGNGLQAIDTRSGAALWKQDHDLLSPIAQMRAVPQGLIVRGAPQLDEKGKLIGKPFVDLLDPKTGRSLWKKPFRGVERTTGFDVCEDLLYISANLQVFAIHMADGATERLAKYHFKGNEVATTVEALDDGVLLSSRRNLLVVGKDGSVKYQRYYPVPGSGVWTKLAPTAETATVSATSQALANEQEVAAENGAPRPTVEHPALLKRFKAGSDAARYTSMVTWINSEGHRKPGLVRIEKSTGKEVARLVLGERTPGYKLDAIEGRVFVRKLKDQIACYRLQTPTPASAQETAR